MYINGSQLFESTVRTFRFVQSSPTHETWTQKLAVQRGHVISFFLIRQILHLRWKLGAGARAVLGHRLGPSRNFFLSRLLSLVPGDTIVLLPRAALELW